MLRLFVAASILLVPVAAGASVRLVGDLPRKDGKALVDLPGLETEYRQVRTSEGTRLRTILTRPAGTTGKLAAIILSQWVSCGSLDFGADRRNELRLIAEKSGMVFVRVERSGSGDSEGVPCSQLVTTPRSGTIARLSTKSPAIPGLIPTGSSFSGAASGRQPLP